jgi:hypothetical protein
MPARATPRERGRANRCALSLALVGLALCAASASVRAQHPLVMLPLDDPAYIQLDALDRVGCRGGRVGVFRPYLVRDVRRALHSSTNDPACPALLLDALQRRFGVEPSGIDSTALLLPRADSAVTRSAASRDTLDARSGLTAGGALTLRATSVGDREFRPLWRDIRPSAEGDPPFVAIARARLRYSAGPRFLALSEVYLQSSGRNDPTARAKTLRGSDTFLEVGDAYLNGTLGPIDISFGRAHEAWLGEGRESLVLSAHGPQLDRLTLSGRWAKVQARSIAALLDRVTLTAGRDLSSTDLPIALNRALVGHAIAWSPVSAIELTLGETMLFTRRAGVLDFGYLNPVSPLIVVQNDRGRDDSAPRDNLMIFGGGRVRLGIAQFAAEVLVDDIQVDDDGANASQQLGIMLEGSLALPTMQPAIASARYRRINSFTYSRSFYSEVYQTYDAPLGSELGPDADRFEAELAYWPNGVLRFSAGAALWRHGATRLERRPSEGPNGRADLPFPSTRPERPLVQRATALQFSARVLTARLPISVSVEAANVSNLNNVAGPTALYLRAQLSGTYALRYP